MSSGTFAVIVGALSVLGTYLGKRLIDYVLPPNRHWGLLERYSHRNDDTEETSDEPKP